MKYIITERQYQLLTENKHSSMLKIVDYIINNNKPDEVSEIKYRFYEPDEHYNVYKLQIIFVITEPTESLKPPRNPKEEFSLGEKSFEWSMKIIKQIEDYFGIKVMIYGREIVFDV